MPTHKALDAQERYEERLWIQTYLDLFAETKDPIALMQAFVISMNLGVYPPVAILHALAGAFQTVLESEGAKKLDVVLGLRGEGRGAWKAFTKQKTHGTAFWLASTLFDLTTGYGLTIAEAAERVSFFLESKPEMKPHEADSLIDQYSRNWKKTFHFDTLPADSWQRPANWDPTFRAAFLKTFPRPDNP